VIRRVGVWWRSCKIALQNPFGRSFSNPTHLVLLNSEKSNASKRPFCTVEPENNPVGQNGLPGVRGGRGLEVEMEVGMEVEVEVEVAKGFEGGGR